MAPPPSFVPVRRVTWLLFFVVARISSSFETEFMPKGSHRLAAMNLELENIPAAQLTAAWPLILGLCAVSFWLYSLYQLFFHPLARIPGPKLAAISHAYEFYHDVIRNGMYIWEIEKMHEKYGKQRGLHISCFFFTWAK